MSERPESAYENEVNRFLRSTAETGAEDLFDCLGRLGLPAGDDALSHEYRRIGLDSPAWSRLEAERRNALPPHERLRESWVELLTNLHFPDDAAPSTELTEAGLQLLLGLVSSFERAGEPLDSARTRAVMALHELIRHPERYRELREQAGLAKAGDTGEEVRSDAAGIDFATPLPWCKPETSSPSSEVLPLVPEDLYLELEDEIPAPHARAKNPSEASEALPVTSEAPERSNEPHEHDSWLTRNLRFKSDQ